MQGQTPLLERSSGLDRMPQLNFSAEALADLQTMDQMDYDPTRKIETVTEYRRLTPEEIGRVATNLEVEYAGFYANLAIIRLQEQMDMMAREEDKKKDDKKKKYDET